AGRPGSALRWRPRVGPYRRLGVDAVACDQGVPDLGEQPDLVAGCLGLRLDTALAEFRELVHRRDHEEIHDRGGEEEPDHDVDEGAVVEYHAVLATDLEDARHLLAAAGELDQRFEERVGELLDHRREGGADDDSDGEVDDVAPRDEVPESLKHDSTLRSFGPPRIRRRSRCAGQDFAAAFMSFLYS